MGIFSSDKDCTIQGVNTCYKTSASVVPILSLWRITTKIIIEDFMPSSPGKEVNIQKFITEGTA